MISYSVIIKVQWLFDFKRFDWFGGHRLSAHILVIDYTIWKTQGNLYFVGKMAESENSRFASVAEVNKQGKNETCYEHVA